MKKISKDKKRALFGVLILGFGVSLGFGFWDLGFPQR
jgi:predicted negative regulator of RcsB-dependent stress response